ncbi:IQ motif, EF-hand binding site [Phytophthora cactorum]|nr:IQ motif, EF-hand binding site [Phytophthora cactorum]
MDTNRDNVSHILSIVTCLQINSNQDEIPRQGVVMPNRSVHSPNDLDRKAAEIAILEPGAESLAATNCIFRDYAHHRTTADRQQQQLEEREKLRQNRNEASIALQSTFRSRLEQKRYQGMQLQRVNAAIAIQCMVRRVKAKRQLRVLQTLDRVAKQRICAASKMQRFTRFRLYRKERALLEEARERDDSSEELIACAAWRVKILGWYPRLKYAKIKASTSWIQKWWRRVSRYRSAYFTLVEAVHCIQSVLKRRSARKWFRREWHRQEKYLEYQVAAMRIQAAWRGRQQHMINIGSQVGAMT